MFILFYWRNFATLWYSESWILKCPKNIVGPLCKCVCVCVCLWKSANIVYKTQQNFQTECYRKVKEKTLKIKSVEKSFIVIFQLKKKITNHLSITRRYHIWFWIMVSADVFLMSSSKVLWVFDWHLGEFLHIFINCIDSKEKYTVGYFFNWYYIWIGLNPFS